MDDDVLDAHLRSDGRQGVKQDVAVPGATPERFRIAWTRKVSPFDSVPARLRHPFLEEFPEDDLGPAPVPASGTVP